MTTATVIFDNGGGITVQLSGADGDWAHWYNGEPATAAGDVRDALSGGFSDFNGDEPEAHDLIPTDDQIRNGGYRVERFDSINELDALTVDWGDGWGNRRDFATANRARVNG